MKMSEFDQDELLGLARLIMYPNESIVLRMDVHGKGVAFDVLGVFLPTGTILEFGTPVPGNMYTLVQMFESYDSGIQLGEVKRTF
jgi:hypothetical protein